MSAGAVGMAVREFLFRRFANLSNCNSEVEVHTSKRVVAVDRDNVFSDLHNRDHHGAGIRIDSELIAQVKILDPIELIARDVLPQSLDPLSVTVFGSDGDLKLIADLLAVQLLLQPGNNPAGSVQVRQWPSAFRRVKHLSVVVCKRVINGDNARPTSLVAENGGIMSGHLVELADLLEFRCEARPQWALLIQSVQQSLGLC